MMWRLFRGVGRIFSGFRAFVLVLVVVAIIAFIAGSIMVWATNRPVEIPNTLYIVTTQTRILYADTPIKLKSGGVTLNDYWEVYHGQWVERKQTVTLQPSQSPNIVKNPNYDQKVTTK